MPILSAASKLRPFGGRVIAAGARRTTMAPQQQSFNFDVARRTVTVLGTNSHKHLLSEFVGVRGPMAEEVRKIAPNSCLSSLRVVCLGAFMAAALSRWCWLSCAHMVHIRLS